MICLGDVCIIDWESVSDCMIKLFFCSSLPFCLLYVLSGVVFSLCDDHQFIDVSICEDYPWSTGK